MTTELTQEEKLARTKRRMIYLKVAAVIAAIIVIFSLVKGCQKAKNTQEAYDRVEKKLQGQVAANVKLKEDSAKLANENNDLLLSREELRADRDMVQGALIDESDKSVRLANELKRAKANKDTIRVFLFCDSLSDVVIVQGFQIKYLKRLSDSLDYYHVQIENNLKAQRDIFKNGYDSCLDAVKFTVTELPKIKPKSKIYFDLTGQVGAITAAGPGIGYLDKNGKYISYNYLISKLGSIHQIKLSAPLSFKRK